MFKILAVILSFLFSVTIMIVMITSILSTLESTDKDKPNKEQKQVAEWRLANTQEIQGTVVSKSDKSYIKKEGSVLFIGGGEKKVENYEMKIQYEKNKFKTIKVKEKQYLNYNEEDNIGIVIDKSNNEVKYDLQDEFDREEYKKYKQLVR
ncbi:hypothetical protein DWB98_13420 (plasmid) [Staphylococcus xylosus]|uniref:hypothetical protein n=1 Tax=Staphylococcus xylosus TaxID=1288 RepID=UPI00118A0927|nr:hypothetical protein [Staphylococcus xylosus]QDW90442.1 hypothetical protein DWB98_13420 [Staphylococcus xylosus]